MKSLLPLKLLLIIIALLGISLLAYTIKTEGGTDRLNSILTPLHFFGTWQNSEDAQPQAIVDNTIPDNKNNMNVTLKGHFDKRIEADSSLLFRVSNIHIQIFQNGEKIYAFGDPGTYPSLSKSPGDQWDVFTPKRPITPEDAITIKIESVYTYTFLDNVYDLFLQNLYMGDSGVLFRHLTVSSGASFFIGGLSLIMGLVLLVSFIMMKLIRIPLSWAPFYLAMFTITSGTWIFLDFNIVSLLVSTNVFTNILDTLCLCLIIPFLGLYVLCFIQNPKAQRPLRFMVYAQLAYTLFFLSVQFMGIWDGYELTPFLLVLVAATMLVMVFSIIYESRHTPKNKDRFVLFSTFLCFISLGDIINYFVEFMNDTVFFTAGFMIFILSQFIYLIFYGRRTLAAAARANALEKELVQNRIAIMLSQIQPHFMFNSLTAIKQLCAMDPARAEEAVGQFAAFLRGNLDSLGQSGSISFEKEMLHIQTYLSLEKMRFGKRLNIVYHTKFKEFSLPPLTVQPLIENAVRYGVTKQPKGGTVTISTEDKGDSITIIVSDDGVGFDPKQKKEDGRSHIGIDNVRSRLEHQCGGSLRVESTPGQGTTAVITIPKKKEVSP